MQDVVYYKGLPYQYKVAEVGGKKMFSLYKRGILQHFVDEQELDKKTIVSRVLDEYFRNTGDSMVPRLVE